MDTEQNGRDILKLKQLYIFFIPLGFSASLVTLSHVIINSTLARSAHPETIIASYAIALSLMGIFERPGVIVRQTCSILVRDRISYRAVMSIAIYALLVTISVGLIIAFTPVGVFVFHQLIGVQADRVAAVIYTFQLIIFVTIFSAIRCFYHGIIITNMRTKWLTFGVSIRIVAMYFVSLYFINTHQVTSGRVGAVIFLTGMIIECIVCVIEGRSLVKKLPHKKADHPIVNKSQVFKFFRPLLYSSFIAVLIGPLINTMLGKTNNIELAIASFAIAASLTSLVSSFFSYMHQIVLQFYKVNDKVVHRFWLQMGFIPCILLGILCYSPVGPWFIEHVMGIKGNLMTASLHTLRVFMAYTLFYPWVDSCNGILMLRGQTKYMIWSQATNATITLLVLILCILLSPGWNGIIGAMAQSMGLLGEFIVVLYVIRITTAKFAEASNP